MTDKIIELGTGVSVTLTPANGWAILKRDAIGDRLGPLVEGSKTLDNYFWHYANCVAQVVSVKGMAWQPPEIWATADDLQANFEAWIKALPDMVPNINLWLSTVFELNNAAVPDELAPGGNPEPDSPKAKKGGKTG